MDSIVIIMMLDRCMEQFPLRYQRYHDNYLLMRYAPDFDYKNWNPASKKHQLDLPTVLSHDDEAYE